MIGDIGDRELTYSHLLGTVEKREIKQSELSDFRRTSLSSRCIHANIVCLHTDVPVFVLRTSTYCNSLFSSSEQHIAPSGYHSLASVDGKGQV